VRYYPAVLLKIYPDNGFDADVNASGEIVITD